TRAPGPRLWARPAAGGDLSGPRPGLRGDALRRRHAEPADDRYHAQCRPSRRGAALAHLALPGRGGDTRRLLTRWRRGWVPSALAMAAAWFERDRPRCDQRQPAGKCLLLLSVVRMKYLVVLCNSH